MNEAFQWCVDALRWLGKLVGLTYEEVNIWIFCIIEPIIFFIMLYLIFYYRTKYKRLKKIEKSTD